jgi:hypothetical protein
MILFGDYSLHFLREFLRGLSERAGIFCDLWLQNLFQRQAGYNLKNEYLDPDLPGEHPDPDLPDQLRKGMSSGPT